MRLLPWPEDPPIAVPARTQPAAPNDISRKTIVHTIRLPVAIAPGSYNIATKRNIIRPNSRPDQRTRILVAMLNAAAISAKPTKYSQNARHGMYDGTILMGISPAKCSAPKTAKGMAKHTWVRATTFWRPRAWAISVLAANRPITSRTRPAADIQKADIPAAILPWPRARVEDQFAQRRCGHLRARLYALAMTGRAACTRRGRRAAAIAAASCSIPRRKVSGDVDANPRTRPFAGCRPM